MTQTSYLKRLARAARWRLSRAEADEVVTDYQELLSEDTRSEKELIRDLGDPVQAVRALGPSRSYGAWLAVFWVLVVFLVFPVVLLLSVSVDLLHAQLAYLMLTAGLALSLVWFFWSDRTWGRGPLPKGLLPLMLLLLCAGCAVVLFVWFNLVDYVQYGSSFLSFLPPGQVGLIIGNLLESLGVLAAALGVLGLVQARISDRRWRALYTLGLTAAALSLYLVSILSGMSLDIGGPNLLVHALKRCIPIAVIGLAATGVSLC